MQTMLQFGLLLDCNMFSQLPCQTNMQENPFEVSVVKSQFHCLPDLNPQWDLGYIHLTLQKHKALRLNCLL